METLTLIVRMVLGLILVVFPINALFIKAFKPAMPDRANQLMEAMRDSGYLLTFIQGTELIVGIMLLIGYQTPIVLLVLAPISLNILLFHYFLAPPIWGPGLLIFALNGFMIYRHLDYYQHLLV